MTELFTALTAAAWMVPNHYPPWPAAWMDALAIAALILLFSSVTLREGGGGLVSWPLTSVTVLSCTVIAVQLINGKLLFAGDAWIVAIYLAVYLAAVLTGGSIAKMASGGGDPLNTLMAAWLVSALLSVGIALAQWTGALNLGIYVTDLPQGARPFANVAQPNNLSTLCFLGLCCLLWLRQCKKIEGVVFWLSANFLLWGMVMTQSRTGWLQIGFLVAWGLVMQVRADLRIDRVKLLLLGAVFSVGVLLWPAICDALLLSPGRSIGDQMQVGIRIPFWRSMVDALGREPLWGYGWQQVGIAQQRVALDHPSVGAMFDHSHNLLLDLLLWNGVPIGGAIVAALAWWFIRHIRACRDARVVWLLAAVGGVFVHAMLEFPLEYAYFLIPVGLAMGAIDTLSPAAGLSLRVPRWAMLTFALLLGTLFIGVSTDYLKAEESYRTLRMESARIGTAGMVTPAPELHLLTQLGAFLHFAQSEATPDMTPEKVDWMRKVSERFGYPPVLFRYALAAGLNGEPETARVTLARLCRIHEPQRCIEAREGWATLQTRYPQLADINIPATEK